MHDYSHWTKLDPALQFAEGEQIVLHLPNDPPVAAGGGDLFPATFRGGRLVLDGTGQEIALNEGWWWMPAAR